MGKSKSRQLENAAAVDGSPQCIGFAGCSTKETQQKSQVRTEIQHALHSTRSHQSTNHRLVLLLLLRERSGGVFLRSNGHGLFSGTGNTLEQLLFWIGIF